MTHSVQTMRCWRQHLANRAGSELLQQYSLTGLLISGAVILGKLVQHGSPTDLHMQLEVQLQGTSLWLPNQNISIWLKINACCAQHEPSHDAQNRQHCLLDMADSMLCACACNAAAAMQAACMAAQLVAACFSCSLAHPQRALDFATYTPIQLSHLAPETVAANLPHAVARTSVSALLEQEQDPRRFQPRLGMLKMPFVMRLDSLHDRM